MGDPYRQFYLDSNDLWASNRYVRRASSIKEPQPEAQLYDKWELSDAEVKAALEYIHKHNAELGDLLQKQTPN